MTTAHPSYAYLSLITFPDGYASDDVARLLADAGVMDSATLRVRLRRPPPIVLGRFEVDVARAGVKAMLRAGGDAFAPTIGNIQSLGSTLKIKDFELIDDGFQIGLWRGGGAIEIVWGKDVQVLVRAQITSTTSKMVKEHGSGASIALGGLGGAPLVGSAAMSRSRDYIKREHSQSDKIDMHTVDGRVFQIDGDKFGFAVLGDMRGHTDNENMDKMLDLLEHLTPNAIVDQYFNLFKPPAGYKRLRLENMSVNSDDPAFAFYSRWAALMYRHVMRG